MKNIEQTYIIPATAAEVWRALTEPRIIKEWSGADAEFQAQVGVPYTLWDGSISGHIIEVVPRKKLVQSWKPDNWTIEDSVVTFMLSPVAEGTRVDMLHENVEDFDFDGTTEGWDLYYIGAIKRMFETKPRSMKTSKSTKDAKDRKKTAPKRGKIKAKRIVAVKKTSIKRK